MLSPLKKNYIISETEQYISKQKDPTLLSQINKRSTSKQHTLLKLKWVPSVWKWVLVNYVGPT